ncbi:MAG: hypothetical protein WCO44_12515 [Bacteroidota bacterium]
MNIDFKVIGKLTEIEGFMRAIRMSMDAKYVIKGTINVFPYSEKDLPVDNTNISEGPDYLLKNEIEQETISETIQKKPSRERNTEKSFGPHNAIPEDVKIHCHYCGSEFHPRTKKTRHCSKKCYMADWYDAHKPKPEPVVFAEPESIPEPEQLETHALKSETKDSKKKEITEPSKRKETRKFKPTKKPVKSDDFGPYY